MVAVFAARRFDSAVYVTSRSFIETADWIELVFGIEATIGLSYIVLIGRNLGIIENNGTFLCILSQIRNLAIFLLFFAAARRLSQVLSTWFDRRLSPIFHTRDFNILRVYNAR